MARTRLACASIFLFVFVLAACNGPEATTPSPSASVEPAQTQVPTITGTPVQQAFSPICEVSPTKGQGIPDPAHDISVEGSTGEHPGWNRYLDTNNGFSFVFPPDWELIQRLDALCLSAQSDPKTKLVIGLKPAGWDGNIQQQGASMGQITSVGRVLFLGQPVEEEIYTAGGKATAVLFNNGTEITAGDMAFSMSLGVYPTTSSPAEISPSIEATAEEILRSFSLMTVTHWTSVSPDGLLVAVQTSARPEDESDLKQVYQRLDIAHTNGIVLWTPVERWQEEALGMTYYQPVRWSADSQTFFFTQAVWGDGCVVFPVNGSTLEKVDSVTGKVTELFEGWAFTIALSPDETQLAYIAEGHYELVFRDLASAQERRVDLDPGWDFQAGYLYWSPDGNNLALTLANWPCQTNDLNIEPFAQSTSTVLVNTATLEVRTLISEDPDHRIVLGWKSNTEIELKDPAGNKSLYDIERGIVSDE